MHLPITLLWLDRCLGIEDNEALYAAIRHAQQHQQPLLAFVSTHRKAWLSEHLPSTKDPHSAALERQSAAFDAQLQLAQHGIQLRVTDLSASTVITALCQESSVSALFTDAHADAEKARLLRAFARSGLAVQRIGSNTLLNADERQALPDQLIGRFTKFYHQVKGIPVARPAERFVLEEIGDPPPSATWPNRLRTLHGDSPRRTNSTHVLPITQGELDAWWQEYLWASRALAKYKHTRNQPMGRTAFSRLSAALAIGTLSPQTVCTHIEAFEHQLEQNESTQWLRYELFWREYFHWAGERLGSALFQAPAPALSTAQARALNAWCNGQTGEGIVDAGMHELLATGFMSNRVRQLAASCLVHNLNVPWQYGAAWFEQHLIDYDVNSNYGNWGYIAGQHPLSAAPHAFDLSWQTQQHDPDGEYRRAWGALN